MRFWICVLIIMANQAATSVIAAAAATEASWSASGFDAFTSRMMVVIVPGDHRDREREDTHIFVAPRLAAGLARLAGRLARAGWPPEEHVNRDKEEQDAAGDAERLARHAKRVEDLLAEGAEDSDNDAGDDRRACDGDEPRASAHAGTDAPLS
jgi:hypothetical protein